MSHPVRIRSVHNWCQACRHNPPTPYPLCFHILYTPTPPEEGWGRQNVDTDLVNIWTDVVREAISIRTL